MLPRFTFFLGLWLVLNGPNLAGIIVGLPAAVLVSWLSTQLLPPSHRCLHLSTALFLGWFFLRNSLIAGLDVAWRAFHPHLPLRPGLVEVECSLPHGPQRDVHLAIGSMLPGSLPVADTMDGRILLHCLDTQQPVAEQMACQENLLRKAWRKKGDA